MLVLKVNRDWSFGGEEVPRISLFSYENREYSLLPSAADNHFRHLSAVIYPRFRPRPSPEHTKRDIALRRREMKSAAVAVSCEMESSSRLPGANAISTRFFFNIQPTANVGERESDSHEILGQGKRGRGERQRRRDQVDSGAQRKFGLKSIYMWDDDEASCRVSSIFETRWK